MPSNGYKWLDSSEQDPIYKMLVKYREHPSIKLIKAKNNSQVFNFSQIDIEEVKKSFQCLDPKKTSQKYKIKTNLLKKCKLFWEVHVWWHFRIWKTQGNIEPAHKKSQSFIDYRPISVLPYVFKIYGRCLYDQMETYFEHIFSRY